VVDGAQQGRKYRDQTSSIREEKRSGQAAISTDDHPMFSAECQATKGNLATAISLIYEFKPKTLNERFL